MRNILYTLILFIAIVLIAISYQIHITNLSDNINSISEKIITSISNKDYTSSEVYMNELEKLWKKNIKILMFFQDHASVNEAEVFINLAANGLKNKEFNQVSDNLISFTCILDELASENKPTLENIL